MWTDTTLRYQKAAAGLPGFPWDQSSSVHSPLVQLSLPIAQEGVMVVHQVLSEGAQGPKVLIRDTLRPEDNPLKENRRHRILGHLKPVCCFWERLWNSKKITTDRRNSEQSFGSPFLASIFFLSFFFDKVSLRCWGWSAVAWSWLTAASNCWAQMILLP